jgi:methylmalonyl-CoA/ethylmalonyl-CoA epimerase
MRVNHFSIAVPDMDEAIDWYREVFGLQLERRSRFDARELRGENAFVSRDGVRIELWALDDAAAVPAERREPNSDLLTCGTKHIGFELEGLQAVVDDLVARGVDFASIQRRRGEPHLAEDHPETSGDPTRQPAFAAFIRDPGGTLIELLDPTEYEKRAIPAPASGTS